MLERSKKTRKSFIVFCFNTVDSIFLFFIPLWFFYSIISTSLTGFFIPFILWFFLSLLLVFLSLTGFLFYYFNTADSLSPFLYSYLFQHRQQSFKQCKQY